MQPGGGGVDDNQPGALAPRDEETAPRNPEMGLDVLRRPFVNEAHDTLLPHAIFSANGPGLNPYHNNGHKPAEPASPLPLVDARCRPPFKAARDVGDRSFSGKL